MTSFISLPTSRPVITVQGPLPSESLGITDAHNHLWIEPVPGADPSAPVLNQYQPILNELIEYHEKGGGSLLDCQPEGCGRDGNRLLALSKESGVNLIACTGFHRKKYYPPNHWLWTVGAQKVCDFLCSELERGLVETLDTRSPVKAGFIKIALGIPPGQTALERPWKAQPRLHIKPKPWLRSIPKKGPWPKKLLDILRIWGFFPNS